MADFDNTNRGVLFKEKDKKNEKGPDWTGKLNVNGKDYRVAAWQKESKDGQGFYSLAVSDPSEYQKKEQPAGYTLEKKDVDESEPINLGDIPF